MINIYDYIVNSTYFKKLKVNDLLFVEYRCLEDKERASYWTSNNAFVYVTKGRKKWEYRQKSFYVSAGQSIFIKKGGFVINQYLDDDFCALLIFVPDHFIQHVVEQSTIAQKNKDWKDTEAIIEVILDPILTTYYHSLLHYFSKKEEPTRELLQLKFKELILNVLSSESNESLADYFCKLLHHGKLSLPEIMETNFFYNLKLEDYARLSGRSLSSFKRDFIKHYGVTPGKWLKEKRLEYSHYLLESTHNSIEEIAFECGFENRSHFITSFRKKYGTPPYHFKKQIQAISEAY